MDMLSVRSLNILLGNSENAPVIEMHFPADIIEFERECLFAVGGADFGPQLNGRAVPCSTVHSASARDVLSFKNRVSGSRAYLAVRGGFCGDQWLGSQSTNLKARLGGFNV